MSRDMQQFSVTDVIRERVRVAIMASMPDEQIDAMVTSEHERFFAEIDRYGNKRESPFRKQVRAEIERCVKERVVAWMDENFDDVYKNGERKVTGEMVAAFVPVVQAEMIESMVSEALVSVRSRLTQDMR